MSQRAAAQLLKNLGRFQLITFDVTDTLLRFRHPVAFVYKQVAEEMGVTDISQQGLEQSFRNEFKAMSQRYPNFGRQSQLSWQQWWLQLVENTFDRERPDLDSGLRALLASKLLRKYRTSECWTKLEGAEELLQQIRISGRNMGVISNFDPSLSTVLQAMRLEQYFDFVITSHEAGAQKPDRRIFEAALARCGGPIEPHQALHIGNVYSLDFVGARAAGWSGVLVGKQRSEVEGERALWYDSMQGLLHALQTEDIQWPSSGEHSK